MRVTYPIQPLPLVRKAPKPDAVQVRPAPENATRQQRRAYEREDLKKLAQLEKQAIRKGRGRGFRTGGGI